MQSRVTLFRVGNALKRTLVAMGLAGIAVAAPWSTPALAQSTTTDASVSEARLQSSLVLTGIVAGDPAGGELTLRARNGVAYRVRPHSGVNLKEIFGGDQVRVFGNTRGQIIQGASVQVLRRGASDSATDYTGSKTRGTVSSMASANTASANVVQVRRNMTLTGTVASTLTNGRFLLRTTHDTVQVRTPGGRSYDIAGGDRVRVYGYRTNEEFQATNLRILRRARRTGNTSNSRDLPVAEMNPVGGAYSVLQVPAAARRVGENIQLSGRVTVNPAGDVFYIRDINGYSHRVHALSGEPANLQTGTRVRTYGDWRNGMMYAGSVRILGPR